MKKGILLAFLVLISLISITGCSTTGKNSTEVYTVATGSDFVPFVFVNEQSGELDGFDVDVMKAIAKEGKFEIKFESISWDGFIAAIETGRYDMGIDGITITEERKEKVDFSDPYFDSGLIIMTQANNQEIKSAKDLIGKKTGTIVNTTSEKFLQLNYPETEIFSYDGSPEAYMDLRSGRLDAVLYDVSSVKYFISKYAGGDLKTVGDIMQGEQYGILFPKASPLAERVNSALSNLIKNGTYDDIYEKWFNERPYGTK